MVIHQYDVKFGLVLLMNKMKLESLTSSLDRSTKKNVYPSSGEDGCKCRFQCHWFGALSWIEYSPIKFAAICFTCFLFSKRSKGKCGSNAFIVVGFQKLKRVNSGKECAFICHMGKVSNYANSYVVKCYENLKNGLWQIA
jgi:hypothetical protein